MNEQDLCQKRLLDLSRQADRKGIVLFSDFLNLNELNIYHQSEKLFATRTESVSYTHLDVYKRQVHIDCTGGDLKYHRCGAGGKCKPGRPEKADHRYGIRDHHYASGILY